MATSSKFDLSSGSPDRPLYTSGQRGAYGSGTMERSSSFRDCTDNPVLSSLPNMSRSSSVANQGDVINFFQCLRFDPKLVAAEHKFNQQGDFKRSISIALGVQLDESPSGPAKGKLLQSPSLEQLKRVKAGLRECCIKSRERIKIFNEALSVHNKFFLVKKRSRSDVFPNDRSVPGTTVGKMGSQSHAGTSAFDLDQQKSEERTKIGAPNKRTRTSLVDVRMDVRSNGVSRPSGAVDRDRDVLRLANSGAVQSEDRAQSIGIDGWGEKPKMKKKRSGIKPDVSSGMVSPKPIDGYRETKQGAQQRLLTDSRSRLNNDSYGYKPGTVGVGKADGASQQTGLSMRSSIPRPEQDTNSLLNDRRDRLFGLDKERLNLRAVNKANVRDDLNSGSPMNAKISASIRGPRSSSGVSPKLSPNVHRATASNDWEVSHCTNKPPAAVGSNNRKRMTSARSSSPPVANWAGQRPQKSSRTARRTNFLPIVSSNDEPPESDSVYEAGGNEIGLGHTRRLSGNSPPNLRVKGESLSSAMLSESEESGAAEIKSKDRGKKSDEFDEKAGLGVQKGSTAVVSSRKSKMVSGAEIGDGVRRQGRTGRGVSSARTIVPMTLEKHGNVGTAKQLRSVKLGFEKSESKVGRPPTRKLSDRKAYTRQRHTSVNATADFLVGSDDGHEELLAAANAVMNPGHALSSPFWKKMESFFGFISDVDITYLKQQVNQGSSMLAPTPGFSDADGNTALDGFGFIGNEKEMGFATETNYTGVLGQGIEDPNMTTLCQRLIAALIPEAENVEVWSGENEDLKFDAYGSGFELDEEFEPESAHYPPLVDFPFARHTAINGYRTSRKSEYEEQDSNIFEILNTGVNSNFRHSRDDGYCDQGLLPNTACTEFQYDSMNINEKLRLEFQSIGIFPEAPPDMAKSGVGRISEDINKLEEEYHMQVSKKKGFLHGLLKSAIERKEFQEREFQHYALDKLVGMAYEKYKSCWGLNAAGSKSSSNKMAKQAALAFVKRTLERYRKFEATNWSCFSEPLFRDMFISGSSTCNGAQSVDTIAEGEFAKLHAGTDTRSLEARVPASMSSQQSPSMTSRSGQNMDNQDVSSSDLVLPVNHSSEHTVKQDTWSNRGKRRELLLDDVVGVTIGGSPSGPLGIGSPLSSSAKGKRSERDREGKGQSREVLSRNGTNKIGRPMLSNVKGERKTKTKPKQKTTQLSVSVNGLIGKISEQPKPAVPRAPKSGEISASSHANEKGQFGLEELDDPIDLSHLQLPGMDVLGGDDLDGQGQDLGSWLNIDDDGLHDDDFMGLEIPMDDLTDLNMMV